MKMQSRKQRSKKEWGVVQEQNILNSFPRRHFQKRDIQNSKNYMKKAQYYSHQKDANSKYDKIWSHSRQESYRWTSTVGTDGLKEAGAAIKQSSGKFIQTENRELHDLATLPLGIHPHQNQHDKQIPMFPCLFQYNSQQPKYELTNIPLKDKWMRKNTYGIIHPLKGYTVILSF